MNKISKQLLLSSAPMALGIGTPQRAARLIRLFSRTLYLLAVLCPSRADPTASRQFHQQAIKTNMLVCHQPGCRFPQSPVRELGMAANARDSPCPKSTQSVVKTAF